MIRPNALHALALLSLTLLADAHAVADEAVAAQRRALVTQKLRLVEALISAPAAKGAAYGREADSPALLEHSAAQVARARQLLAEENYDQATQVLDAALRDASAASAKLGRSATLSDSAQRESLASLREQVATYRRSLADALPDASGDGDISALLARLDAMTMQAEQLAAAGRLGEANKRLADTYKLAVSEIARRRSGQTVVHNLHFDTPAAEYAYEQKRFQSNEILLGMMHNEGRVEGERGRTVDTLIGQGRSHRREAAQAADQGRFEAAVPLMEQANAQLTRALQTLGVPVF